MSCSSRFSSTFWVEACSAFRTLPRKGRIAWVLRSRPCLAEPPAESPSTMKSSLSAGSVDEQSASFPGRFKRCETAVLRVTSADAARDASLARAARMMRATTASAMVLFSFRYCSSAGRMRPSIMLAASALLRRSLVWPWNCGLVRYRDRIAQMPSRMSSAESVTPLGVSSCVEM